MNNIYPIIVMLSIATLAHGAATEPADGKKSDAQTQKTKPSPLNVSSKPTSKLPVIQMTAATFSIIKPTTDRHPSTYVPGMPGMQFSDHSHYDHYDHHDHTLYG